MTGFAREETTTAGGSLVCELRSVNHRFLEAGLRLSEELRGLESELRAALARELRRGKVDCTLQFRPAAGTDRNAEIDHGALAQLLGRLRDVSAALPDLGGVDPRLDLIDVLKWPGIVRDTVVDPEPVIAAARTLFTAALKDMSHARAREGARLAELIEQRCAALESLVAQVKRRLPEVLTHIRTRIVARIHELQLEVDRERLEQEIALILQRMDVAEELDRLTGHIEEIRRVLMAPEPAGRRLDFLMQELNREANTLSSKSQDLETTRAAVDMKVSIEQMREQVQNIE
ncbi:MAG: YicC/YloC family endoribonuclease [Steroidobacteraceae bacterium]